MKGYWILKGIKFAVLGAAFVALAGLAVMGLWNWLLPSILGVTAITWCQALGILVLARILVGGRGWGGGGRCGGCQCGGGGHRSHWRSKWESKWQNMTPEQREHFKAKWEQKCGVKSTPASPKSDAPFQSPESPEQAS